MKYTKVLTLLFAGLICVSLTACGGLTEEEASTVVQSELDYFYYNKASDEFLELCGTSKEEIDTIYNEGLEEGIEEVLVTFGLDESAVDQDLKDTVLNYASKVFNNVKFEVGAATKVDDYFTVPVTIYPIDMTNLLSDDAYNEIYASIEDQYYDGMTEEELYNAAFTTIFQYMTDEMDQTGSITYADPVTLTVKVVPVDEDSTKYYQIDNDDLETISNSVVLYE